MHSRIKFIAALGVALVALIHGQHVEASTLLKNICRGKGQEESTIQGMGLVIGLAGTGDSTSFQPTIRALATVLERMNNPLGEKGMLELKDAKNVALVMVTATVPAAGARQGDRIDCTVSAIGSAKSLEKGILLTTPLLGPQTNDPRVYGFAQGPLQFDDAKIKTTARIGRGCRLEEDFNHPFIKDGKFTLVLNPSHADFQVAFEVAEVINSQSQIGDVGIREERLAHAVDAVNIEVTIPKEYHDTPVEFISTVLTVPIVEPQTPSRVVINERAGTIVIDGDVEISAVAVHVGDLYVEAGQPNNGNRFVAIETATKPTPKLKSLIEALDALQVPAEEKIAIIKGIERAGKLHGALVIE
jgi:flagellar P-ring protein precursor FlgI